MTGDARPGHVLRVPEAQDEAEILRLNNRHAVELSFLTPEAFRARVTGVIGAIDALMIAFDQGARYASPNFLWFRNRFARFVYIDRVVVAEAARGRGLARALYHDLMVAARDAGHALLCCEVNSDPPNPGSDRFHASLGFSEIGAAPLPGVGKSVRYLTRALDGSLPARPSLESARSRWAST